MDIPRAMSVREGSPLWRPDCFEIGRKVEISLNGVSQAKVISYDIDAGFIRRYETDVAGNIVLNKARDAGMEEICEGVVAVSWKAD